MVSKESFISLGDTLWGKHNPLRTIEEFCKKTLSSNNDHSKGLEVCLAEILVEMLNELKEAEKNRDLPEKFNSIVGKHLKKRANNTGRPTEDISSKVGNKYKDFEFELYEQNLVFNEYEKLTGLPNKAETVALNLGMSKKKVEKLFTAASKRLKAQQS
jgi:hypothetical protein